ncbi:hypothetical protein LWC34_39075 [Kibdelosporangium philippinense]|uniref:Hemophore-related protein, Rv0203/Rv1174c family n=1 Tax=Kibdelosporangium philippinense TaxID=211113 RepID=A0ABS8ZSG8_9PSEU|nr:hypothetical protein [Kibdelosporangium philippinense]MCE7008772.1 hypothetical protein [Kibdelosporangium philippinense]
MKLTLRIATATVLGLALLTPAANAQTPTFDVKKVCEQRVPKLENRVTKALTRINGGADVRGSVANLRARAERATDPAQKDWLNGKADHRAERVDVLKKAQERLGAYKQKYCTGK